MIALRSRNKFLLKAGFTLVELSIVLVIIGLIIGGVLVGRDLIDAAAIRAQISQIEKYNSAVNTFRGKYGYLPGDIPDPTATQYGFGGRGPFPGEGDGNGLLQIWSAGWGLVGVAAGCAGEVMTFWVDLSTANLINGGFNTAGGHPPSCPDVSGAQLNIYFPQAKIGQGNFVYIWSASGPWATDQSGINYYGIAAITDVSTGDAMTASPGLTVSQAYNIDKKVDDGSPQSGRVTARYVNNNVDVNNPIWAGVSPGVSVGPSGTTCYDNNSSATSIMNYTTGQNGGAGINCALSFRFQ